MRNDYFWDRKSPPWSIMEALLVISLVLAFNLLVPLQKMVWFQGLSRALSPGNYQLGAMFWGSLLRSLFFVGLIAVSIKLKYRLPWSEVGLHRDREGLWLKKGLVQGIVLFVGVTLTGIIISLFYPLEIEPQPIAIVISSAKGWKGIIIPFLVASVFAPLSEELYFRGYLYPALGKKMGKIPALLVTSSFFGIMHFDLVRFIPLALGGLWLNLLYENTRSLYTPILAHSVWNSLMVILIFIQPYVAVN